MAAAPCATWRRSSVNNFRMWGTDAGLQKYVFLEPDHRGRRRARAPRFRGAMTSRWGCARGRRIWAGSSWRVMSSFTSGTQAVAPRRARSLRLRARSAHAQSVGRRRDHGVLRQSAAASGRTVARDDSLSRSPRRSRRCRRRQGARCIQSGRASFDAWIKFIGPTRTRRTPRSATT